MDGDRDGRGEDAAHPGPVTDLSGRDVWARAAEQARRDRARAETRALAQQASALRIRRPGL